MTTLQKTPSSPPPVRLLDTWQAFWAMVKKELIVMARYPVNFVMSFAQVFIIVAVFALAGSMFSTQELGNSGSPEINGVVSYGFILFIFMSETLWNIGVSVRREQVQGTLEQLYLSPASKFANLVSRVMNILLWTGLLSILSIFVMSSILGRLPYENVGLALFILAFSLSGTFGVGFAFAALALRLKETANTLANLLQFAFLVLCANFFPFSALPDWLLVVSRAIPLSYSVDAFRSTLMGYPAGYPELAPINTEIVIVVIFGTLMPLIGFWLYSRAEKRARRIGSLAEF